MTRFIYHITHYRNLTSIIEGGLLSDAKCIEDAVAPTEIGMAHIKQRRLRLPVSCHDETFVGEYVPFYFCNRSIMLYLLHKKNDEIQHKGGQDPILHICIKLNDAIQWSKENEIRWAISKSNAAGKYAEFSCELSVTDELDWQAIGKRDWRAVKEQKQAEFLLFERCPWELVESIGVRTIHAKNQVDQIVVIAAHNPPVRVEPNWYY